MKDKLVIIDSIMLTKVRRDPQIGSLIIQNLLKEDFDVELISFSNMYANSQIEFAEDIDQNIDFFTEYIYSKKPDIVSFYTICDSFYISVKIAECLKKIDSNITIIMGGPHATLIAKDILVDFPFVDIVSMGEGEKTVFSIMKNCRNVEVLKNLAGVGIRYDGDVIINVNKELISNEELSKYTPMDFEPYSISASDVLSIEGGRGCPFSCNFCSTSKFWGRKYRIKEIDILIREMDYYYNKFSVKKFSIQHDLFTANNKKILYFCEQLIEQQKGYYWGCSSRVDVLTHSLIDSMVQAGCVGVFLGIETGSDRMQKILNKNLNLEKALETIRYMKDRGLDLDLSFIYCYPDETVEDFQKTANLIGEVLKLGIRNVNLHVFMLLPETYETEKVYNRAYFKPEFLERSIFNPNAYNKKAYEYIKMYKKEFIQFYTFDSEVRNKYRHFNLWVKILVDTYYIYGFAIRTLLDCVGIIKMYEENESLLYEIVREEASMTLKEFSRRKMKIYVLFMQKVIERFMECFSTYENKTILQLENAISFHFLNEDVGSKIYKFPFDVLNFRNARIFLPEETYIKIFKKDETNIKVTKMKRKE